MKTTLLIMAAGIGSRFGGGIKQLEPVGLNDEIIMDYSIHDAIKAGFNKIIFVIRREIENDFKERIGNRIEEICQKSGVEVFYAYQDLNDLPNGFSAPADRKKPWGTGHAVLSARSIINEPFMVINADDYYGKDAFFKLHDYLVNAGSENDYCMAGFILKNTLSENGGVSRGVCKVDGEDLVDVTETHNIIKTSSGASSEGKEIDPNSFVSMNMWGFPAPEGHRPSYLDKLESSFVDFLKNYVPENPQKVEYLLPNHIGMLLKKGEISVKVLKTEDKWFGVTYKEDKQLVVDSFKSLIEAGAYNKDLYSDLK